MDVKMKWHSIKKYIPPMDTMCLIFTENNYQYVGRLVDEGNPDVWIVDSECDHHGSMHEKIYGVTHFLIADPVPIDDELN
jgi:hypothetical protein